MSTAALPSAAAQRAYSLGDLWHLTSLDAPVVAALWLRLFSPHISVAATCALTLAVWMLYAADRLLDARSMHGVLEERHRFHALHRRIFIPLMVGSVPLLALLVWQTEPQVREAWLLLGLPLIVYLAAIHATRVRMPKELAVGLFFGGACAAPAALRHGLLETLPVAAPFGALCFVNCAAIAAWEARGSHDWAEMHPLTRMAARHITAVCAGLIVASMLMLAYTHIHPVARACVLSATLLMVLHTSRISSSRLMQRVLADAALLTPLLLLPATLR